MKRFKGFGTRRHVDSNPSNPPPSPHCFPNLYTLARDSSHRRRSVDVRVADASTPIPGAAMRRRSVDDGRSVESVDLQAVRKEWKSSSSSAATVSSSDSFSSSISSSRSSDASAVSSDTIRYAMRDTVRVVVVGFDANAKGGGVSDSVMWAFHNTGMQRGDALVLVGVLDTVRGPMGYKVQVNDQKWLRSSKKFLDEDIKAKNLAWSREFPVLRMRCIDAGVTFHVVVRVAPRPEETIVHEATARGASHVVLDKSLHNKRRRYYEEHLLGCDVTRMRRSGGVDTIRAHNPNSPSSPTSVLHPHRRPPQASEPRHSTSHLSRLAKLTHEKPSFVSNSTGRQSSNPTIDEEELFCIDHDFLTRRVEMLLELEPEPDFGLHGGRDQLFVEDGYESDDLFSLAGDGVSRRASLAVFAIESARNSMRSSISRVMELAPG